QYDKCIRHLLAKCQGSTLWGNAPKSGICPGENTIIEDDLLNNFTYHLVPFNFPLTELGGSRNSKVALAARQLLISVQTPSYELRRNQYAMYFLGGPSLWISIRPHDVVDRLITLVVRDLTPVRLLVKYTLST
ncbi:unnamed protein product, partial [Schistosoma mattheei]